MVGNKKELCRLEALDFHNPELFLKPRKEDFQT
jgi:hypothetical protein